MPTYRVAVNRPMLDSAPDIKADGPAVAAARYVEDNNMRPGRYLVREVPEEYDVEVSISRSVEAKLIGQGGVPATVEAEVPE